MVVTHSTLTDNAAVTNGNAGGTNGGGAIYNMCGRLTVDRSTLRGNTVVANGNQAPPHSPGFNGGGAIFNDAGNGIAILRSTVASNTVTARGNTGRSNGGGGILTQVGSLVIDVSTIADNTANVAGATDYDGGGGILDVYTDGTIIHSSTISDNTANLMGATGRYLGGGGVKDDSVQPSSYVNTTVAGNVTNVRQGIGNGGGGLNVTGTAQLTQVTLAGNTSRHAAGGGLFVSSGAGRVALKNTIVAGNSAPVAQSCARDRLGTFASLGYNLLSRGTCGAAARTDQLGVNPRLGPLRRNGGPTATLALPAGSRAVGAIPHSACTESTDQRGIRRTGRCDIGAYERG